MSVGASSVSQVIGTSRHEAPINPTAGVAVAGHSAESDLLVVGTASGAVCVLDFSLRTSGQSFANVTTNLEHKIIFIVPLDGQDGVSLLACGLADGSVVLLEWPSLACLGTIPTVAAPVAESARSSSADDDVLRVPYQQGSYCVQLVPFSSDREGRELCVATSSGYLTSVKIVIDKTSTGIFNFQRALLQETATVPWIGVAVVSGLVSEATTTEAEDSNILAACTSSGRVHLIDLPITVSPEIGGVIARRCIVDVSPLFTSPLRAFKAGNFAVSEQNYDDQGKEEACLFFFLASGEVLVFHSLATQLGTGPLVPQGQDRYLFHPGVRGDLATATRIKPRYAARQEENTDSSTLIWAVTLPESELEAMRREISDLKAAARTAIHVELS
jgi:hypothetical protein